jgi:arsenite methyltransferase
MKEAPLQRPSLENLLESEDLGLEILHPGGLGTTRELATLCHIARGHKVLDVASGTGESICFLAQEFGCRVVGVDTSPYMVTRARAKSVQRGLPLEFLQGDAHNLPFGENTFDSVLSECTVCLLDKKRAIGQMVRVAKPGGYVGMHDICWREDTPEQLKTRLAELEGESPETLEGWQHLFEDAGLLDVTTVDKSDVIAEWDESIRKELGVWGQARVFLKAFRKWGIRGLRDVEESARIFQSQHTGYGIIVGRKPE